MSTRTKIIFGVLGAFVIAALGYLFITSNSSSGSAAISSSGDTSQAEALFLNLSQQLDTISFDTSVLSDPRFTSLVDIHTPILPETTGRTDPFAPLPIDASSGS